MKKPRLFVLFLFFNSVLIAQQLSWVDQFTIPYGGYSQMYWCDAKSNGNLLAAGLFEDSVDFDPGPGMHTLSTNNPYNFFLAEYDSSSNLVWVRDLDYQPNPPSILRDASDAIYIINRVTNPMDIDPGPGTFFPSLNDPASYYFAKYDANGNFLWAKSYGASGYSYIQQAAIDANGNIAVLYKFQGTIDIQPGPGTNLVIAPGTGTTQVLVLYDANANVLWTNHFIQGNSEYIEFAKISFTPDSRIVTGGFFRGLCDFDRTAAVYNLVSDTLSDDAFLVSWDISGNLEWAISIRGNTDDIPSDLVTDLNGNTYISGSSSDTLVDFDPGPSIVHPPYMSPWAWMSLRWMASYDSDGNLRWVRQTGIAPNEMVLDPWNKISSIGTHIFQSDYDPGPGGKTFPMNTNTVFFKLDTMSLFKGATAYAGVHVASNSVSSHCFSHTGRLYVIGGLFDTTNFALDGASHELQPPQALYQMYIASYTGAYGNLSINETESYSEVHVYPNPSNALVNFDFENEEAVSIFIYDLHGREINRVNIMGKHASVNAWAMAAGMYSYTVLNKSGETIYRGKFSVTK